MKQADKDLDMLIKIACKLTQEQKSAKKKREVIVDVDELELSLDVPLEKQLCKNSKTMETSLEDIRKVLDCANEEEKDEEIRVKHVFFVKVSINSQHHYFSKHCFM